MRALSACLALVVFYAVDRAEAGDDRVKKQLRSDNYTVTWGAAPDFASDAALEIGNGNGHGGALAWVRFHPGKDAVDVLSIQFDNGRRPYESKWPPDRAPVTVKRARLKSDAYAALLRDLAVVGAAKLKPVEREVDTASSNDFWVSARLTTDKKTLLDLDWAGYAGSGSEHEFAKPQAAVGLAWEAIEGLDFKNHTLTEGERAWASAKFAREWKKFKGLDFHWWVRAISSGILYVDVVKVVGEVVRECVNGFEWWS